MRECFRFWNKTVSRFFSSSALFVHNSPNPCCGGWNSTTRPQTAGSIWLWRVFTNACGEGISLRLYCYLKQMMLILILRDAFFSLLETSVLFHFSTNWFEIFLTNNSASSTSRTSCLKVDSCGSGGSMFIHYLRGGFLFQPLSYLWKIIRWIIWLWSSFCIYSALLASQLRWES